MIAYVATPWTGTGQPGSDPYIAQLAVDYQCHCQNIGDQEAQHVIPHINEMVCLVRAPVEIIAAIDRDPVYDVLVVIDEPEGSPTFPVQEPPDA
jgi:hypothetical protein